MNPDDVDRLVREVRSPERGDGYWRDFPGQVVRRLRTERAGAVRLRPLRLGAAFAVAAACGLIIGFALWHRGLPAADPYVAMRDGRVLREMQKQYPGRLQAIIQDESGLRTQLSDVADVSPSEPILLEIRDGRDRRVIVTFSGQLVRLGDRSVTVLSDVGGQVMLFGDGFFWSRQASAGRADLVQIRAEQIPDGPVRPKPSPPL
jgi:hypothetical protein